MITLWIIAFIVYAPCISVVLLYVRRCTRLEHVAEAEARAAEEHRAAALETRLTAELEVPDGVPSWVVMGWHRDGKDLVMASDTLQRADFRQRRWVEQASAPGMSKPLNLTRRECTLDLAFPVYTLLHNIRNFEDAFLRLRRVWK